MRKEIAMTGRDRRVRPGLDQLEAKTLLSAGITGHAGAGRPALSARTEQASYFNYINVRASGFTATNVSWKLYVQGSQIDSRFIGTVGSALVPVKSSVGTSFSFPGQFVFTYNNGSARRQTSGYGTSWNGQGPPPSIPTLTLTSTGLGGHEHHGRHHHGC
jgi:hypothetical protein